MTYAHRLVEIQVRGVLIVVILNGNKHWMSINLCCRSGVEPIAPNGLQLTEGGLFGNKGLPAFG